MAFSILATLGAGLLVSAQVSLSGIEQNQFGDITYVEMTRQVTSIEQLDVTAQLTIRRKDPTGHVSEESRIEKLRLIEVDGDYFAEDKITKRCALFGGELEVISVKAGMFKTCKAEMPDGCTKWLGPVPFSTVKVVCPTRYPHPYTELELVAY